MNKNAVLRKIYATAIVPVIRAQSEAEAIKITEALYQGGINIFEITMTVPGALDVIKELRKIYCENDGVVVGAGSVLDAISAKAAIQSGAQFVVGPTVNLEMIKLCNQYQIPVIPGAMTPTEVMTAIGCGADVVKIFPAGLFGPQIIKDIKGPMPQVPLMPTGGVNLDNVVDWIKAGSFAVGVGSALVGKSGQDDYQGVTQLAKKYVSQIRTVRN